MRAIVIGVWARVVPVRREREREIVSHAHGMRGLLGGRLRERGGVARRRKEFLSTGRNASVGENKSTLYVEISLLQILVVHTFIHLRATQSVVSTMTTRKEEVN